MLNIDRFSGVPVYQQIVEQYRRMIAAGIVRPKELIPSVRALSLELSVNPNTVQKAYAELEQCGLTASVPGVGRFVAPQARELLEQMCLGCLDQLKKDCTELKSAGVPLSKAVQAVREVYGVTELTIEEEGKQHD